MPGATPAAASAWETIHESPSQTRIVTGPKLFWDSVRTIRKLSRKLTRPWNYLGAVSELYRDYLGTVPDLLDADRYVLDSGRYLLEFDWIQSISTRIC